MRCSYTLAQAILVGITWAFVTNDLAVRAADLPGSELFARKWVSHDKQSLGDGLGPMHNAASCVTCHDQGGVGGAGGLQHNVDLLSVVLPSRKLTAEDQGNLAMNLGQLHAGFANNGGTFNQTVVLHRFGPEGEYYSFRAKLLGINDSRAGDDPLPRATVVAAATKRRSKQNPFSANITHGNTVLRRTQRNTPALWGAGLIDSIPGPVLEELAAHQAKERSDISGRVARTNSGGVGRFGWRGQIETLRAFVLAACANELGLQTTGHAQAVNPLASHYRPEQTDLSPADAASLIDFVANLPKPVALEPKSEFDKKTLQTGTRVFERIGCVTCHVRQVGLVEGIFSDLLLHDMGEGLEDPAAAAPARRPRERNPMRNNGGGWAGGSSDLFDQESNTPELVREWRTPPLWSVADSAPYMHDGRAETLADAILLHGGEAAMTITRYRELTSEDRTALFFFLKSLVAP